MMRVVLDLCRRVVTQPVHTAIINHDVMPPNGIQNLIAVTDDRVAFTKNSRSRILLW